LSDILMLMGAQPGTTPQGGGGAAMIQFITMIVLIVGVMYFFMIRPQQKKEKLRQKMLSELKKGDKVLTNSGIIGVIWGIKDNAYVIKVDEEVKIEFVKSAIAGKME
jgi:preprotein translocase subunit YajC